MTALAQTEPLVDPKPAPPLCECGADARHEQGGGFYCCGCYTRKMNAYCSILRKLQQILGGK